jgi:hypothetical protein
LSHVHSPTALPFEKYGGGLGQFTTEKNAKSKFKSFKKITNKKPNL